MIRSEKHRWLSYVKENLGKVNQVIMAKHIGISKRGLSRWIKEWRAENALPPSKMLESGWKHPSMANSEKWLVYLQENIDKLSLQQMANHIGVKKNTVKSWVIARRKSGDLPARIPTKIIWEDYKQYITEAVKTKTRPEIAEILGVGTATLDVYMRKWELSSAPESNEKWIPWIEENTKMNRKDMASHIGIARGTLIKWITVWRKEGKIHNRIDWEILKPYIEEKAPIMSQEDIAKELQVPCHSLHKRMKKWNIKVKARTNRDQWKQWILDNRNNKLLEEMSVHIGVAQSTIGRWLTDWRKDGTEIPGIHRAQPKIKKERVQKTPVQKIERVRKTPLPLEPEEKERRRLERERIWAENRRIRERQKEIDRLKKEKEKTMRKMVTKVSPVKKNILPTRQRDESQYKYVQVNSKTRIQIPIEADPQKAIESWLSKHNKIAS